MTLQAGGKSSRAIGFTLVEILLVLAILGVLTAVSAPRFRRTYESLAIKNAAFDLYQALHFMRSRAITGGHPLKIRFDFEQASYRLFEELEVSEGGGRLVKTSYAPIPGRLGRSTRITPSWTLKGSPAEVVCRPNGICQPGSWHLSCPEGSFEILIEPLTSEIVLREVPL